MNYTKLVSDIRYEFSLINKPNKKDISPYYDKEARELVDAIYSHDNLSVPDKIVERYSSYLPFFSHQGLRYYLPAFLTHSIIHTNSDCCESVMFELFLKFDKKDRYWVERMSVYTQKEKMLIVKFIKYIQTRDEEGFFTNNEYKEVLERWG